MSLGSLHAKGDTKVQIRWWDITAAILLLVAIFTAASRLEATGWTNSLSIIPYIVLFGVIFGLALGQSRFRPWLVSLFGLGYGLFIIGWQLGSTINSGLPWVDRLAKISSRTSIVILQIANRQIVTDSIFFIILMASLFWVLSLSAGYVLTRYGNAWWAILPTGIVILIIHSFDPLISRRALYLAVYIFFSLLLIARMTFLQNQVRWKENRAMLPPHLGLDFIRFALTAVTIMVLVAWTVPALAKSVPAVVEATQPIRASWANLRNRWETAFSSLRSNVGVYTDRYGDNITLGRGSILNDTPVFIVTPPDTAPSNVRYYWRALTYDDYSDGQWINTIFTKYSFNPDGEPLVLPEYQGRLADTFQFTPATYVSTLFSPPQPFWVSVDADALLAQNPDETVDIAGFRANKTLRPQQSYQIQSSVSNATIHQLRHSDQAYPDWVKERYLNLPETITPRTRQLAEQITAGIDNPYDKVIAITNYLRNNIVYQDTIPAVPRGQEPIDWFLFDLRKGFCNYYATAEVVLLRSIGIPARWAIGYAQGERQTDGHYLVRQLDAHSWPEVYFSGFGWIEFEPTVSQPDIQRLSGEPNSTANNQNSEEDINRLRHNQLEELADQRQAFSNSTPLPTRSIWVVILPWMIAGLLTTIIAFVIWKNRARFSLPPVPVILETTLRRMGIRPPRGLRLWAERASLPPLTKSYQEINRALTRLGEKSLPTRTPTERASKLGEILPPAETPSYSLLHEYQLATFSEQTPNIDIARQAGAEIRNLSYKAFLNKLIGRR